jgi:Holliday junction DNA helicase RuvA
MDSDSFVRSVQRDDTSTLVKLPGVGKKTAERLMIEMRDRLKDWILELDSVAPASVRAPGKGEMLAEAESALVALGYKPTDASRAVAAVDHDDIKKSEELIRAALKSMVRAK